MTIKHFLSIKVNALMQIIYSLSLKKLDACSKPQSIFIYPYNCYNNIKTCLSTNFIPILPQLHDL